MRCNGMRPLYSLATTIRYACTYHGRFLDSGLETALILEDDVDWDVRLRQNLQRFALATRFLSENKETLSGNSKYDLEIIKNPETPETGFHILSETPAFCFYAKVALFSMP